MCRAIANEATHGSLSRIFQNSIKSVQDLEKLTDCTLPSNVECKLICDIFKQPHHRDNCNNLVPCRLKFPPVNGRPLVSRKNEKSLINSPLEILANFLQKDSKPSTNEPLTIVLHFKKENYIYTVPYEQTEYKTSLYDVLSSLRKEKEVFLRFHRDQVKKLREKTAEVSFTFSEANFTASIDELKKKTRQTEYF